MNWRRFCVIAAMSLSASTAVWAADDGGTLYKKRCAACHGAAGEGKAGMKAPALKGTAKDVDQLVQHITKGEPASKAPHNKGMSGLSDDQAKAIAEFVKTL